MDNPFKKILNYDELPDNFKDKVMKDISFLKFSIEMADLFVVKYPSVIAEFLNLDSETKDKKSK